MQPIFHAIIGNDIPAFLGLVEERESSLDERSEEQNVSNTVLHIAVMHGHRELTSKIIELRPSLVRSLNAYGNTPLHLAAFYGDVNIVMQILETGLEECSALNNNDQTPLHIACGNNSMEAARLIVEKTQFIGLDELDFAISCGFTCISGIILERFPDLATVEYWEVEGGPRSSLLHHACDRGDLELTRILLGLDQRLEEAINTDGLSPLHMAVLRGSVVILEEFLEKAPLSFNSLTPSKETVFHLAARKRNIDAFVFMAESLGINSQNLLQQTDEDGNTVLHTAAASVVCGAPLICYIVDKEIIDVSYKNNMGLAASHLLSQEAHEFELLSSWLKFENKTSEELDFENDIEEHDGHSNLTQTESLKPVTPLHKTKREDEMIRLLRHIVKNTGETANKKRRREQEAERGRNSLEYEMHIEALQNARNTIAIVAVLIASVAYAGGINPPGGVYQDGPWRGKSIVGKTTAFKVFAICNNIALFTLLCIVILLVSIIPYKRKPLRRLLVVTHRMMWVSVGFMATAYLAASWVIIPHYHGTRWLFPAIISVASGALMVLFSYLGIETVGHWSRKMNSLGDKPSFARTCSDLAASGVSGYFVY